MKNKVKIGILIDYKDLDVFSIEIIRWLEKNNNKFSVFFFDQNLKKKKFLDKLFKLVINLRIFYIINTIFYKILIFIERRYILNKFYVKLLKKKNSFHLSKKKLIKLNPVKKKSKFFLEFDEISIKKIEKLNLDFLIRFGSGILRGKILKSSKNGVISFHHGDNKLFRGGPAGFWETYNGINSSGFVIQQLTNKLDAGNIIFRGLFKTEPYFLNNQYNLRFRSNYYLKKIFEQYYKDRKFTFLKRYKVPDKIYKNPNFLQVIIYFLKILFRKLFAMKKINNWNIAVYKGNYKSINHKMSICAPQSDKYFLADPFIYKHNNNYFIFAEKFIYSEDKGKIVVFKLEKNSLIELGTAIREKFHLSFPYIFKYKKKIYLIPDSSSNKDLRIYISEKFPLKWKLYKIVLKNVKATDTLIYKQNKNWEIITNLNPNNTDDLNSELFLFKSANPIKKNWQEQKNNPLIVNFLKARNGGIIIEKNKIYRVFQKHKFNDYGNSISLSKINSKNNNQKFEYDKIPNLKFLRQINKCHHLNSNGKISTYDYV